MRESGRLTDKLQKSAVCVGMLVCYVTQVQSFCMFMLTTLE